MPAFPYYPRYPQRFALSTATWTDEEVGAYCRLLDYQWDHGSIPADAARRNRIAESLERTWPTLADKFEAGEDGELRNGFLESLREKVETISQKRRDAANARWNSTPSGDANAYANAYANGMHPKSQILNPKSKDLNPSQPKKKRAAPAAALDVEIPLQLQSPDFIAKWGEWIEWRKDEHKKRVTPRAAKLQLTKLAKFPVAAAIASIEESIGNDWTGLFPEKLNGNGKRPTPGYDPDAGMHKPRAPGAETVVKIGWD